MGRLTRVGARFGREARSKEATRARSRSPTRPQASSVTQAARALLAKAYIYRTHIATASCLFLIIFLAWPNSRRDNQRAISLHQTDNKWVARRAAVETTSTATLTTSGSDSSSSSGAGSVSTAATTASSATTTTSSSASSSTTSSVSAGIAAKVSDLRTLADQTLHAILNARNTVSRAELDKLLVTVPPKHQTLRFPVCNGFANQRLSVVYGVLLAYRLGRTPVLPVLVRNGIQRNDAAVTASGTNKEPFEAVYDINFFLYEMAKAGIRVLENHEAPLPSTYTDATLASVGPSVAQGLNSSYGHVQHLAIDCPLFKLAPQELEAKRDEPVIWAALDAMRPADKFHRMVVTMSHHIKQLGGPNGANGKPAPRFNYLHLRLENDWVEHCKRWSSIPDGVVRDNCYNNTETIDVSLKLFAFPTDTPLYVASYWDDVDPDRAKTVMGRLAAAGYRVITSADVFPEELRGLDREMRALVEYFVGLEANKFIGNSVSTFAALALLERRHRGQWAAYYNGGNLPIAPYLPVHKLPWVFTYNSWSEKYDYMLKGAVKSAAFYNTLKPYCIFDGNTSSAIYHWLVDNKVTMISHMPTWRNELIKRAQSRMQDNVQHSHLFKNPDMLVSTFQRVDLPVVPILDQYTYVLYTDCDVYFRRPIHLDDFGLPLPRSVSMSYEMDKMFPYNAGIIVANLPVMRRNYKAFLTMMLDNDNGLYYPNYGPADQGIINKFYEHDLRSQMLNQAFNTKPYNDFDPSSFLIHYHGPKPHEYLSYLDTGKCDFFSLCEQAFLRALCQYAREWAVHIPEEIVATRLSDACIWLSNPTISAVFQKKVGLVAQNK